MSVASKNLYDLLGNDEDSDTPKAPVKTVDKASTHTVKRNTDGAAPAKPAPAGAATGRRGGFTGSEAAFRDRQAGSDRNRGKPTDDATAGARGGRGTRARGGRGGRAPRDDRHTKGLATGSEKQAAQSWGAPEGNAELKDEQAGEAIAQSEQKEAAAEGDAEETPAEPEDKSISYDAYLAQQAEKKLALAEALELRKPNEGTKEDKKWASAKPLVKEDDDAFMVGSGAKAKRERERKTKQILELENRYIEPAERTRGASRGGRGGGRGGETRGDRRGGGRGGSRGDFRGESRGDFRGGRGDFRGESRGDSRGGRGGRDSAAPINTKDTSAFPSLGGK